MEENIKYTLLAVGIIALVIVMFAYQGNVSSTSPATGFVTLSGTDNRYIAEVILLFLQLELQLLLFKVQEAIVIILLR